MGNIYDIIKTQKAEIDVKFASYDLMYVTEHFTNNEELYYLEEGFKEKAKNAANAVIEFIKNIIKRIGELIDKAINFFRRGRKDVQDLENQIKDANNGTNTKKEDPEEKARREKEDREREERIKYYDKKIEANREEIKANREKFEKEMREKERQSAEEKAKREEQAKRDRVHEKAKKRAANLHEVLKNSNQKVSIKDYTALNKKMELSNNFFNAVNAALKEVYSKKITNPDIFVDLVVDKTFRKGGSHDVNGGKAMSVDNRIKLELFESEEKHERNVGVLADKIMKYLNETDNAIKYLEGQKRAANDTLNKLLSMVGANDIATSLDKDAEKIINVIRVSASIVSEFVNAMCRNISTTYSAYFIVAKKVTDDYSRSM